jgi:phosphoethanolamine N-methyltransferase
MVELLGEKGAQHFIEDWRSMTVVLDKGEMRPGRYRARKPV